MKSIRKSKRHNFNKGVKLHIACSDDDYRIVMNHIYFDNGYAVASNGYVIIKAYLKEISSFTDEEIEMLNGKFLHRDAFKELIKYNDVEVDKDGFLVKTDLFSMKINFYSKDDIKYPNYEKVISSLSKEKIDFIGISLNRLSLLTECINQDKVKLEFNGTENGIIVKFLSEKIINSIGLIMPAYT